MEGTAVSVHTAPSLIPLTDQLLVAMGCQIDTNSREYAPVVYRLHGYMIYHQDGTWKLRFMCPNSTFIATEAISTLDGLFRCLDHIARKYGEQNGFKQGRAMGEQDLAQAREQYRQLVEERKRVVVEEKKCPDCHCVLSRCECDEDCDDDDDYDDFDDDYEDDDCDDDDDDDDF